MKYLTILISTLLLVGCTKNDNTLEAIQPIEGYYSLTLVSCECDPIEIREHQQQWKFDFESKEVNVKVTGNVKSHLLLDSGKYNFEITNSGLIEIIQINGRQFGLSMNENSINLSSGAPIGLFDLPSYIFVRNK